MLQIMHIQQAMICSKSSMSDYFCAEAFGFEGFWGFRKYLELWVSGVWVGFQVLFFDVWDEGLGASKTQGFPIWGFSSGRFRVWV